jgi:hypothetical protein
MNLFSFILDFLDRPVVTPLHQSDLWSLLEAKYVFGVAVREGKGFHIKSIANPMMLCGITR